MFDLISFKYKQLKYIADALSKKFGNLVSNSWQTISSLGNLMPSDKIRGNKSTKDRIGVFNWLLTRSSSHTTYGVQVTAGKSTSSLPTTC
jgi:hypothetical protein